MTQADNSAQPWRQEVIYQIIIDRFAGYHTAKDWKTSRFIGGTIRGITESLDYFDQLGATCLYLSPFLKGIAYHGYHVTDFYAMDERFGTLADLQELVQLAHQRGMKVIVDFVPNHCSIQHPYFIDAQANPESQYRDWFVFERWPDKYQSFLHFTYLPKLNLEYPAAREHIIAAAEYWIRELAIDGLRLDHVIGPYPDFWQAFHARLTALKPGIILLGEAWMDDIDKAKLYARRSDIHMPLTATEIGRLRSDTSLQEHILTAYGQLFDGYLDFVSGDHFRDFVKAKISSGELRSRLHEHYRRLPSSMLLPTMLGNQDTNRILYTAAGNIDRMLEAATVQMEQSQPAIIYYGTELGMTQQYALSHLASRYGILAREPMPPLAERDVDGRIFKHYQRIIAERKAR